MANYWPFPRRIFPGIEFGLLLIALVCAGFAPWHAAQTSVERPLTDAQKTRLVRTLQPMAPAFATLEVWSDDLPSNVRYRADLARVFQAAGVHTDAASSTRTVAVREPGLVIGVHDKDRPPQKAIAFLRALRKGGLDPTFMQDARLEDRPQDFTVGIVSAGRPRAVTETASATR